MAGNQNKSTGLSDRALEMIMRDVMGGMMEFSMDSALSGSCMEFEIIEIEPARKKYRPDNQADSQAKQGDHANPAEIVDFPFKYRAWG